MRRSRRFILGSISATGIVSLAPAFARILGPSSGPGAPSGVGTPPTNINGTAWRQQGAFTQGQMLAGMTSNPTGIMSFRGLSLSANGSVTFQWWIDNSPIGNPITQSFPEPTGICFPTSYDSTLLTNGAHVIWGRWVDADQTRLTDLHVTSQMIVVDNPTGTYSQGAQDMYVSPSQPNLQLFNPSMPDLLHYGGNPNPTQPSFPMPVINPPGSSSTYRGDISPFFIQAPCGSHMEEYSGTVFWRTLYTGSDFGPHGVLVDWYNGEDNQSTPDAYQHQLTLPYQDGERGDNFVSAFLTLKELPSGRVLFVEINGRLCLVTDSGTVTTIAGLTHDKSKLTFNRDIQGISEALDNSVKIVVGNFIDDIDLGGVQDIAFDPRNENILYLPSILDHIIIKVDMTGWPGTPATVSLWAGQPGVAGSANGSPLSATFQSPSACDMDSSGNLYIADQENCLIRKITTTSAGVAGTVSTVVGQAGSPTFSQAYVTPATYSPTSTVHFADPAYVCFPSGLRINSTGSLVIFEVPTFNFRRIDLSTSTIHYIGAYNNGANQGSGSAIPRGWGQIDVDVNGMIGPVDDVISALSGGSLEDVAWRVSSTNTPYSSSYGGGAGWSNFSVAARGGAFPKVLHYNWAMTISRLYGKFWASALQAPAFTVARLANSNDPPAPGDTERSTCDAGAGVFFLGTVTGRGAKTVYYPQTGFTTGPPTWPWQLRPSFWVIRGDFGAGHLGIFPGANTFDEMCATYPTDAALGAYLQSGMGSSMPRPEFTGNDLRDLMYFIRINTAAGSNYPTAATVGADDPDTGNYPTITLISAVRNADTAIASSITVSWTTDKPTIGFAAGGSPAQAALNSWPIFSPVENMTVPYSAHGPTSGGLVHSATINNLPKGVSPIHYIVQVRDQAGNVRYTGDQTIA